MSSPGCSPPRSPHETGRRQATPLQALAVPEALQPETATPPSSAGSSAAAPPAQLVAEHDDFPLGESPPPCPVEQPPTAADSLSQLMPPDRTGAGNDAAERPEGASRSTSVPRLRVEGIAPPTATPPGQPLFENEAEQRLINAEVAAVGSDAVLYTDRDTLPPGTATCTESSTLAAAEPAKNAGFPAARPTAVVVIATGTASAIAPPRARSISIGATGVTSRQRSRRAASAAPAPFRLGFTAAAAAACLSSPPPGVPEGHRQALALVDAKALLNHVSELRASRQTALVTKEMAEAAETEAKRPVWLKEDVLAWARAEKRRAGGARPRQSDADDDPREAMYRRAVAQAERVAAKIQKLRSELEARELAEATHQPAVSPAVAARGHRTQEARDKDNERWALRRAAKIERKRRALAMEEQKELADAAAARQASKLSAASAQLAAGRAPITECWQQEMLQRQARAEAAAAEHRPSFVPLINSRTSTKRQTAAVVDGGGATPLLKGRPGDDAAESPAPRGPPSSSGSPAPASWGLRRSNSSGTRASVSESVAAELEWRRQRAEERKAVEEARAAGRLGADGRPLPPPPKLSDDEVARHLAAMAESVERTKSRAARLAEQRREADMREATFAPAINAGSSGRADRHWARAGERERRAAEEAAEESKSREPTEEEAAAARRRAADRRKQQEEFLRRAERNAAASRERLAKVGEETEGARLAECTFAPRVAAKTDRIFAGRFSPARAAFHSRGDSVPLAIAGAPIVPGLALGDGALGLSSGLGAASVGQLLGSPAPPDPESLAALGEALGPSVALLAGHVDPMVASPGVLPTAATPGDLAARLAALTAGVSPSPLIDTTTAHGAASPSALPPAAAAAGDSADGCASTVEESLARWQALEAAIPR